MLLRLDLGPPDSSNTLWSNAARGCKMSRPCRSESGGFVSAAPVGPAVGTTHPRFDSSGGSHTHDQGR